MHTTDIRPVSRYVFKNSDPTDLSAVVYVDSVAEGVVSYRYEDDIRENRHGSFDMPVARFARTFRRIAIHEMGV